MGFCCLVLYACFKIKRVYYLLRFNKSAHQITCGRIVTEVVQMFSLCKLIYLINYSTVLGF